MRNHNQDAAALIAASPTTLLATLFVLLVGFLTMLVCLDSCDDLSLPLTMCRMLHLVMLLAILTVPQMRSPCLRHGGKTIIVFYHSCISTKHVGVLG